MSSLDHDTVEELLLIIREVFDEEYYEESNPDVAHAGIDPLGHFILNGMNEGRAPSPKTGSESIRLKIVRALGHIPTQDDLQALYDFQRRRADWRRRIKHRVGRFRQTIFPKNENFASIPSTEAEIIENLSNVVDLHAFNALSHSGSAFEKKNEAIEYLLDEGYKTLDPLDFHLAFDKSFHEGLYPETGAKSDSEAYRDWLTRGIFTGKYVSEHHLLKNQGIKASRISHIFDSTSYAAHFHDIPIEWTPEQILEHFVTTGIREGRLGIEFSEEMVPVLEDRIEALYHADASQAARAAERLSMNGIESERLTILIGRHLLDLDRLAAANALLMDKTSDVPIEDFWLNYQRAEVFKRAEKTELAIDELKRAIEIEDDSVWVEGEYQGALATRFHHTQARVTKLANLGEVERGRNELRSAIDFAYENLKLYGVDANDNASVSSSKRSRSRPLRVGLLADCFLPQCRLYRVDQKIEQLERAGIHAKLYDFREDAFAALQDIGLYDAWIFYRTPAHFDVLKVIKAANAIGRHNHLRN